MRVAHRCEIDEICIELRRQNSLLADPKKLDNAQKEQQRLHALLEAAHAENKEVIAQYENRLKELQTGQDMVPAFMDALLRVGEMTDLVMGADRNDPSDARGD